MLSDNFKTYETVCQEYEIGKKTAHAFEPIKHRQMIHSAGQRGWNLRGFRLVGLQMLDLTPSEALEVLGYHRYEKNRAFNNLWAASLAEEILYLDLAVAYTNGSDMPILVNGHHSLLAAANQPNILRASVRVFQCKNQEAFGWLFSSFDSNKKRSFAETIKVHRQLSPTQIDLPDNWWAKISSAVRCVPNGFNKVPFGTNAQRLRDAKDPQILAFGTFLYNIAYVHGMPSGSHALPNAVIAAFYSMWKSKPEKAKAFIKSYLSGENLKTGMPALTLRNRIVNRGRKEHAANSHMDFVRCAYAAWTAYLNNEEILPAQLKKPKKSVPSHDQW